MSKYTLVKKDAFKKMQFGAGILCTQFNPEDGTVQDEHIIGATTGGFKFDAKPSYKDDGEDIDNAPDNAMEFKSIENVEVVMSGTLVTVDTASAKLLIGAADVLGNKVTPRNYLKPDDFATIWWVGDYSDDTTNENGGFVAIKMDNVLTNDGFSIQTGKKEKGNFPFSLMAHYSIANIDKVPYELYIKAGGALPAAANVKKGN